MNDQRITAREFRIGNWITVMGSLPTQVTAEHLYMMETYKPIDPKEANYTEMTEPILLTEEWLLKFGFKSVGKLHPTFKLRNYLLEENMMREGKYFLRQIINKSDSLCLSGEIKYVHQLQNLYFSLTGTELTIKETTL